jgi:hypothetical protein
LVVLLRIETDIFSAGKFGHGIWGKELSTENIDGANAGTARTCLSIAFSPFLANPRQAPEWSLNAFSYFSINREKAASGIFRKNPY